MISLYVIASGSAGARLKILKGWIMDVVVTVEAIINTIRLDLIFCYVFYSLHFIKE